MCLLHCTYVIVTSFIKEGNTGASKEGNVGANKKRNNKIYW